MLSGMETMTALDASFLHVEDAVSHMHIGSVGIFEGPAPPQQVVLDAIAAKLHLVPRYRQHVRFPPLALARPIWVDDRHFQLDYHVRRTALPAPGGDEQLRNLVGRVMAQKLDRSSRSGRRGSSRASATAAGRSSTRSTTAWSTASPARTS